MDTTKYNKFYSFLVYLYFHRWGKKKAAKIRYIICFYLESSLYLIKEQEMRKEVSEKASCRRNRNQVYSSPLLQIVSDLISFILQIRT